MIDATDLPDRDERFAMAEDGFRFFTSNGYQAVGFDHFALPSDSMAIATRQGTLRRNFQGFTDDTADVLIGLGSSSISGFPDLIAQNEKKNGRYRVLSAQGRLSASVGIVRSAEDQMRGRLIEALLCKGTAKLSPCLFSQVQDRLGPFLARGLATLEGMTLTITPTGLPYARVIASLFDRFRETTLKRFSSAI